MKKNITYNDLIEKAKKEFEIFKGEMISLDKEELFEKTHIIEDYKHMLEIIENGRVEAAGRIVLLKLYNSENALKALYYLWTAEELPGYAEDEDYFISSALKEL